MSKYTDYAEGAYNMGLVRVGADVHIPAEPKRRIFCPLKKSGMAGGAECSGERCAYSDGAGCLRTCPTPNIGKLCPLPCNVTCDTSCGFYKEERGE